MPKKTRRAAQRRRPRGTRSGIGQSPRSREHRRRRSVDRDPSGDAARRRSTVDDPRGVLRQRQLRDAVWPAACAAALLGLTTAMVIVGLSDKLHRALVPHFPSGVSGIPRATVVGAALLALAVGVRLPQRFAMWICALAWRRFVTRGLSSDMSDVMIGPGSADRPLYWLAFSVIALVTGILTALLPAFVSFAATLYAWMHQHFIWSAWPLELLHFSISFAVLLLPLSFLGLAISCAHHLCCRFGQWETRATAWLMIGVPPGTYLAIFLATSNASGDPTLAVAALPALLVSLCAAGLGSYRGRDSAPDTTEDPPPLPIWSDRRPELLRASIVAVGAGCVCAMVVWNTCLAETFEHREPLIGLMALAFGIGILTGCRKSRFATRSIGGFGTAVTLAGVVVALGILGCPPKPGGGLILTALLPCAGVGAIGFATAYGRQTLLTRVASRSSVGAKILTRLLVVSALTVLILAPLTIQAVGEMATLMMLALFLVAMGGTLIIYEPGCPPQVRFARLCAVLGAIATMVALTARPLQSRGTTEAPAKALLDQHAPKGAPLSPETAAPRNNDR